MSHRWKPLKFYTGISINCGKVILHLRAQGTEARPETDETGHLLVSLWHTEGHGTVFSWTLKGNQENVSPSVDGTFSRLMELGRDDFDGTRPRDVPSVVVDDRDSVINSKGQFERSPVSGSVIDWRRCTLWGSIYTGRLGEGLRAECFTAYFILPITKIWWFKTPLSMVLCRLNLCSFQES